jgi:tripeptide aminopeptidase
MDKLLDRFFNYVSFDTQSKANVKHVPSTDGQLKLARALQQEMIALGFERVSLSEHGCVMGTWPGNVAWPVPAVGFIAHLDTSPDFSGKHVNPQIVENYRGGDIALGIGDEVLSPVMFPILHQMLGQTLITTDGKTLLGADDKAGIAEILTAMVRLRARKIPHGDIRVAFTPDEEVGKGAQLFDVAAFNAEWAYTVDGGGVGELECENFNAASVIRRCRRTKRRRPPKATRAFITSAASRAAWSAPKCTISCATSSVRGLRRVSARWWTSLARSAKACPAIAISK